jgi:hypothetical protein
MVATSQNLMDASRVPKGCRGANWVLYRLPHCRLCSQYSILKTGSRISSSRLHVTLTYLLVASLDWLRIFHLNSSYSHVSNTRLRARAIPAPLFNTSLELPYWMLHHSRIFISLVGASTSSYVRIHKSGFYVISGNVSPSFHGRCS